MLNASDTPQAASRRRERRYDHFYLPDEDHLCLTKQVMDELHYEHTDGQNVLTMKKRL
jgi:anti-sigma regulatory factor (Ser/Thr protein kinase)